MRHARRTTQVCISTCLALLFIAGALAANGDQPGAANSTTDCSMVSDQTIKAAVIAALRAAVPPITGVQTTFHVTVDSRVVKVRGDVTSSYDERRIISIADDVECVDSVDTDNLSIKRSDAQIKVAALDLLKMLPCLVSTRIRVSVAGGVATLAGDVPSKEFKRAAKHLVAAADGVKRVNNYLAVTPIELPPDCNTVNCSAVTDTQMKRWVESVIINTKVSCKSVFVEVTVMNKIVTLNGTGIESARKKIEDAVTPTTICCAVRIDNNIMDGPPDCPPGSIRCITQEGEQWCCYGCRRGCPLF